MAITIRGDRLRYDFTVDGQRYNDTIDDMRVSDFPNEKAAKKAARDWEAKFKLSIQEKVAAEEHKLRLSSAVERMWEEQWHKNASGEQQRQQMESIIKILGDIPLPEITNDTIAKLKEDLRARKDMDLTDPENERWIGRPRSDSTINRYLAAFRTILRRASIQWRLMPSVPYFPMEEEPGKEMTILSLEAQKYLLQACNSQYRDLFTVLWECGMRVSELLNATVDDLDYDGEYAMLRVPQNKEDDPDKLVPLSPVALEILERRGKERNDGDGRFFKVKNRHTVLRYLQRAKERAKELAKQDNVRIRIDALKVHSLRHTTGTRLAKLTKDPHIVQQQLNHASITTSMRYIHYTKADAAKALKKLSAIINEQPESPSPTVLAD